MGFLLPCEKTTCGCGLTDTRLDAMHYRQNLCVSFSLHQPPHISGLFHLNGSLLQTPITLLAYSNYLIEVVVGRAVPKNIVSFYSQAPNRRHGSKIVNMAQKSITFCASKTVISISAIDTNIQP